MKRRRHSNGHQPIKLSNAEGIQTASAIETGVAHQTFKRRSHSNAAGIETKKLRNAVGY